MVSFFNKFDQIGNVAFNSLTPIPGTTDLFALGRKGNDALITRLNANGNVISEMVYALPGRSCFFVQGLIIGDNALMALGSILTNNVNGRRHLVVKMLFNGQVQWAKEMYNPATRNFIKGISLPPRGLVLTGWNTYGLDRIGVERTDWEGNLHNSFELNFGGDEQFYDVMRFQDELLFVGGTNKASRWDGFILRSTVDGTKTLAHRLTFYDTNILDEIDATLPWGNNRFIVAGHSPNDIFVTVGSYSGNDLILEPLRMANLNFPCKVRRLMQRGEYLYLLGFNTSNSTHFIIKYAIWNIGSNEAKIWVKKFDTEGTCFLTDLISAEDGLYLCGFLRGTGVGGIVEDKPIFIKTDEELNSCLTQVVRTNQYEGERQSLLIQPLSPVVGRIVSTSTHVTLAGKENKSSVQELCTIGSVENCPFAMTAWNALEPRTRTRNIEKALQAEIRDAFWMLSRQWQWGEFKGEDGGSIVYSKVGLNTTKLNRYTQLVNGPKNSPYDDERPLEYVVEKSTVNIANDWMLRMEAGNYWMKLLQKKFTADPNKLNTYKQGFLSAYSLRLPDEPANLTDVDYLKFAQLRSNETTWAVLCTAQGRTLDGMLLLNAIDDNSISSLGFIVAADLNDIQDIRNIFSEKYLPHYNISIAPDPAWSKNHLEHQFAYSAPSLDGTPSLLQLIGREYSGEKLDWFSVDVGNHIIDDNLGENFNDSVTESNVNLLIPAKINFPGMPHPRWWQMEDHQISFGDMLMNTTDISKLLLLDFMVNYAGNWYTIPHEAMVGSLIRVEGIEVKDNFGIRTLVKSANSASQGWSVFELENAPDGSLLFLAPTIDQLMEGKPVEKVNFIRDEMANMIWGVEQTISSGLSSGQDAHEAAVALKHFLEREAEQTNTAPPSAEEQTVLKFQLATTVLENWIPFIPVHVTGSKRSIQLQRAAMPRLTEGFGNSNVEPRTILLKGPDSPYYIHEEEVPKAGRVVSASWQRARWFGGKTFLWYGHTKQVGRGGGTSGLKFDQIKHGK